MLSMRQEAAQNLSLHPPLLALPPAAGEGTPRTCDSVSPPNMLAGCARGAARKDSALGSRAESATQLAIDSGSGVQGKACTSARANCSGVHTCAQQSADAPSGSRVL